MTNIGIIIQLHFFYNFKSNFHSLRHTYATILKQKEISLKAIAVCMGHYGTRITEDVYINLPDEIYDCDKEITAFMEEVLPKQRNILDARINEKYLLEVLPNKVYNITDCTIRMVCSMIQTVFCMLFTK